MIDIYYKSYAKDFPLLKYSLMSLQKNITGYNKIIIEVPRTNTYEINLLIKDFIELPIIIRASKETFNGYIYQQYCKLTCHIYSDADFILFADSDLIFDKKIELSNYIKDNKPQILYTHYSKVGNAICWQTPTEDFIKEKIEYEFMRRLPLIYHRSTLINFNKRFTRLEDYLSECNRFSEFNALGAFAFLNEKEKYSFVNTDNWEYEPPMGTQLWSWADKNGDETHQREYQRSLDTINKALNINLTEL